MFIRARKRSGFAQARAFPDREPSSAPDGSARRLFPLLSFFGLSLSFLSFFFFGENFIPPSWSLMLAGETRAAAAAEASTVTNNLILFK